MAIGLVIVGFVFKVSVVFFHVWVLDVYQGVSILVVAFLAVGSKVAGLVVLGWVCLVVFGFEVDVLFVFLVGFVVFFIVVGSFIVLF